MTEAQAKRTRLKVWQDILTAAGGTPRQGDTLYQTIRKTAVQLGISMGCCSLLPVPVMVHEIALAADGGSFVDTIAIGGEGGDQIGGEGGGGVQAESLIMVYSNATVYQSMRDLAVAMGASIPCCDLPPIQIIPITPGTPPEPDANVLGPETGGIFGMEDGAWVGREW